MATRRERVILELQDNFSTPMAKAAANAALLDRALSRIDKNSKSAVTNLDKLGDSTNGLNAQLTRTGGLLGSLSDDATGFGKLGRTTDTAGRQIDRLSGRLALFAKLGATLGPAFIPIGAVAVPAITGLAAQLGAAALAGGTAVVAFQGVGTALEAVNKAALEPTAENLEAARIAMQAIGPEAQAFVSEIRGMVPALQAVRNAAAAGLFPGLTDSLADLESMLPRVEQIMFAIGDALGSIAADSAQSLAGPRWSEFLTFIETEIPSALTTLGQTIGNLTHGLAELWMAFTPVNNDFASWMLDASEAFDKWSQGLSETDGFQGFVDYLRENGPRVAEAMKSIGNAILQVVEAAAPLGGPVLAAVAAFADAVAAIADSDLGTPIMAAVAAMSAYSLVTRAATAANLSFANSSLLSWQQTKGLAVGVGVLAMSMTDLDEKSGLSNTAMLAMMGTMAGPWGAAAGAAAGFALDFAAANDEMEAAIRSADSALNSGKISEQIMELANLEVATDKASAGFLDLGNITGLIANPIDAAKSSFNLLSGSTGDARDKIEQLKRSINGGSVGFGALRVNLDSTAGATNRASGAFQQATGSALSFQQSIARVNAVLSGRASFRDYEQALDDLAAKLKEVGDTDILTKGGKIDISIPEGREVQELLDNIAGSALKVAESLKGADRVRYLARARGDFVDFAAQILGSRQAARALADQLGLLGKQKVKPEVDVDTSDAKGKIDDTRSWLRDIGMMRPTPTVDVNTGPAAAGIAWINSALNRIPDEDVFINVKTRRTNEGGGFGAVAADGATVPKTGKHYADRHLYLLADGEEVISNRNGQADRHRSLLKAINANRRLATGGTVGGTQTGSTYGFNVVDMAARRAANSLDNLSGMGKKELATRQRLLEKELDRDKQRLDMLKQERKAIADAVSSAFATDVFSGQGSTYLEAKVPEGFSPQTLEESQAQAAYEAQIAAINQQIAIGQQQNALTAGIAEKKEAIRLLKILRQRGLNGPAFVNLAATGDVATLRAYVDMSKAELRRYEQNTNQDLRLQQQVGAFAGNSEMGPAIREQTREVRESRQELRQVNQRLHRLEKLAERNPKETGNAVADGLNGAAGRGQRKR